MVDEDANKLTRVSGVIDRKDVPFGHPVVEFCGVVCSWSATERKDGTWFIQLVELPAIPTFFWPE